MPALLLAGAPPVAAIGTNKSQAIFGTSVASATVLRAKVITVEDVKRPFVRSMIGSLCGAIVVQQVNADALDVLVPIVVGLIGGYFLFAPRVGDVESEPRMRPGLYRNTVVPVIGFYDGFFGPGTGSFFALSGVALRGLELVKATATAKTLNLASNLSALAVFVVSGQVLWAATAVMMVGQFVGASVGARTMIAGGSRVIRPLIVVVSAAMLLKWFIG